MNISLDRTSPMRTPILLGCVGAVVMGLLSCCVLGGLAAAPALTGSVPPPPAPDPTQQDLTIIVAEEFLNRMLTDSLPGGGSGKATMDVQPNNRLVVTAKFDLLLTELQVVTVVLLTAEAGQLQIAVESLEAGGEDLLGLLGVDGSELTGAMSGVIQEQIVAGLGEGAQILELTTNEEQIIIMARWAP